MELLGLVDKFPNRNPSILIPVFKNGKKHLTQIISEINHEIIGFYENSFSDDEINSLKEVLCKNLNVNSFPIKIGDKAIYVLRNSNKETHIVDFESFIKKLSFEFRLYNNHQVDIQTIQFLLEASYFLEIPSLIKNYKSKYIGYYFENGIIIELNDSFNYKKILLSDTESIFSFYEIIINSFTNTTISFKDIISMNDEDVYLGQYIISKHQLNELKINNLKIYNKINDSLSSIEFQKKQNRLIDKILKSTKKNVKIELKKINKLIESNYPISEINLDNPIKIFMNRFYTLFNRVYFELTFSNLRKKGSFIKVYIDDIILKRKNK